MDAIIALNTRRSIRQYAPRPVPRPLLEKALAAASQAPTARNLQPWEFVVVLEKERLRKIAAYTDNGRFIATAAACIAFLCQDTKYYLEDGVGAVVNCLNALHALGLGACWVAGDKKPYCSAILQMLHAPANMKLVALVACGFPQGATPVQTKRALATMMHWDNFTVPG
ncbi:nitroreductase family protein [candidate division FCPU426 bacterium]|nr:nitroreductase family protein [candidate division FCPU426 bacterium]